MNKEELQYTVIQTANKHSRAVFTAEGIEIRLAKKLSQNQKQQHIKELLSRMEKMEDKQAKRITITPFVNIRPNEEYCLQLCNQQTLQINTTISAKFRFKKNTALNWSIKLPSNYNSQLLERRLWKELSCDGYEFFQQELKVINTNTFNVTLKNVTIKHAKSMWGNCKSTGGIMLNTALLFVPPHLCTYVIIHELAHRIEANHSAKFWKQVEAHCKTYKQDRKELHTYRLR